MKKARSTTLVEHNQYTPEQNRNGIERLVFFSDAVFAIAITVLILDIHLPPGGDTANDRQLLIMLAGLWHKYFAYIISFWVIGLYWMNHHRKFLFLKRFDYRLLALNILFLMIIAFIPFPTAVISENASRTASVFYALVMALGGIVFAILWLHAANSHNLIDPHLNRQRRRREAAGIFIIAAVFLVSIGVAFLAEGLVRICWLLIIPASIFTNLRRESA